MKDNLTDQRFGRLIVVDLDGITINGKYRWLCSCECGGSAIVTTDMLRSDHSRSCGCLRAEAAAATGRAKAIEPRIGERHHRLVVLAAAGRDDAGKVLVRCRCDCGRTVVMRWGNVRSGNSKSCGCYVRTRKYAPTMAHPWRASA